MHRIRTTTAALVSAVALTVAGAPVAAHAAAPEKDPCAKREVQVEKAEKALAHVTAVFARQKAHVKDARAALKHADNRSERAAARAELHAAKVKKERVAKAKKAQQQRLAKANERLEACQAGAGSAG